MGKIDDATIQSLKAAGYEMGRAFAVGLAQGIAEAFAGLAEDDYTVPVDGDDSAPEQEFKTCVMDCRGCWCDTCEWLESCGMHRDGAEPEGHRPSPCCGCKNGMRFKPRENPPCEDYKAMEGHNYD